jgi:hypothetical protein
MENIIFGPGIQSLPGIFEPGNQYVSVFQAMPRHMSG